MSAKKAKPTAFPGMLAIATTAVSRGRWIVALALFVIVVAVGWRLTWNRVRERVLSDKDYFVNPRDFVISTLPPWIHTDLKSEVIRDASLDGSLSLLDDDLTKRVANAFSLHPWVAKVHRVSKHHPARIEVHLAYRQPAAMIEVSGGLLAVDADGVLLPSADFSEAEAKKYPRVTRIESHPIGSFGADWGDANVTGAAKIASVLVSRWQRLKLYRILAPSQSAALEADRALGEGLPATPPIDRYTYELSTHAGTRILWGRPPGSEPTGEAPALLKIELLDRIAAETGSLDGSSGPQWIDLRRGDITQPRTALHPSSPLKK